MVTALPLRLAVHAVEDASSAPDDAGVRPGVGRPGITLALFDLESLAVKLVIEQTDSAAPRTGLRKGITTESATSSAASMMD